MEQQLKVFVDAPANVIEELSNGTAVVIQDVCMEAFVEISEGDICLFKSDCDIAFPEDTL